MASNLAVFKAHSTQEIKQRLLIALAEFSHILPRSKSAPILLKPNLNSNMNALTGNTTDLRIISALVQVLQDMGYSNIVIGEGTNSGFYRNEIGVISRLKVDKLAKFFGVKVKDLNYAEPYEIPFENGVRAQVAKDCVTADLLINLPKLKTHFEVGMSVCLKNLMGCLVGQENKKKTHQSLPANILMINDAVKPQLHIVDALIAMEGLGPTRGTPVLMNTILVGNDPFAVDLACARLARFDHRQVRTLKLAEEQGLLTREHWKLVESLDLAGIQRPFQPPKPKPLAGFIHHPKRQRYFMAIRNTPLFNHLAATDWFGKLLFLSGLRQDVFSKQEMICRSLKWNPAVCEGCGLCRRYCPLERELPDQLNESREPCLHCLYCYLVCPNKAIQFEGEVGFLEEQLRQYDRIIRTLHRERC